jgi:putative selenium metabolism protein SsnA
MSGLLLKNAAGWTLDPPELSSGDLRIAGGTIADRGANLRPEPGDEIVDCSGLLVLPGLVCAHTHLYSSLSRGMPFPKEPPKDFPDRLAKIWWRLDRALDANTIRASAVAGVLEAVRCGVTTIVDHHSSPNAIGGSLDIIANVLRDVGVRGVLCYETSDRDGSRCRDEALAENERFLRAPGKLCRGLVGAHASFTLSDATLDALGALARRYDTGVHIHVAEDRSDQDLTQSAHGSTILERLRRSAVLRNGSVFAHCVHLRDNEYAELRGSGAWLIHNPRSNMNNGVGHAPVHLFGDRAALGTDGWPADLWEEARAGYLRGQEQADGRPDVPSMLAVLSGGSRLAAGLFGGSFGSFAPGAVADLVFLEYAPPSPVDAGTLPAHLLFGLGSSMVRSVMVDGRWVVRDRRFVCVDEHALLAECARSAQRLWERMHALPV